MQLTPNEFLRDHGKDLDMYEYCFGIDNNQDKHQVWHGAEKKILIVFLSDGATRSVSNTFSILQNTIKDRYGDRVFVDNCYLPGKQDVETWSKAHMEFMFGNVSHRNWREYDMILMSCAILQEIWNVPYVLNGAKIPLDFEERMDDPDIPLIIFGGVSSTMADILYGEYEPGKGCLVDGVYIGHLEPGIGPVFDTLLAHDNLKKVDKRELLMELATTSKNFLVPKWYDYDFHLDDEYGYKIESITPREGLPKQAQFAHMDHMNYPGFENKVLNNSGEAVTSGDLDISSGCSGGGACVFCYEGVVGGKWLQRPLNLVAERMSQIRLAAAPNTIGFYSYNLNYYGGFIDLLAEAAQRFSNLSLINMRADVIGADPRYLDLSILLGLRRASMAVEGIGERMRNNFLNKNLTMEQWKAAVRSVFKARLAECKHGLIYTGYETQDDFDNSIDEFRQIIDIRSQMGANTAVRTTITPLVYYPHTPLERLRRETSIQNLKWERKLSPFLHRMKDLGIRSKVNGRSRSTFMEQFILDFGRIGTKFLVHCVADIPPYYGNVSKHIEEKLLSALHKDGIDPLRFMQGKPPEAILWHGAVRTLTPSYLDNWVVDAMSDKANGFKTRQCTTSPANIAEIRAGTAEQEIIATCQDCGQCASIDEQETVVSRSVGSVRDFKEVMLAINTARPRSMTLVGVNIKPEYHHISAQMLSHKITGLIMQTDPKQLEPKFYQVSKTSLNWIVGNFQRDWFSGRFMFPILWNQPPEISDLAMAQVNKELTSCQLYTINAPQLPDKRFVKLSDKVLWRIDTNAFNTDYFKKGFLDFDGMLPVAQKAMARELILENKHFPGLQAPVIMDVGTKTVMYLTLPMQANPYLYISKIMGTTFKKTLKDVNISAMMTVREGQALCATCNEHVHEDLLGLTKLKQCPTCVSKVLIGKELDAQAVTA